MIGPTHFVTQGQFYVEHIDPARTITTILGSCIAACIHTPGLPAGGMNHFLLASRTDGNLGAASYGSTAMELLINGLMKLGASRSDMRAHVFGGADMLNGISKVGGNNARFCLDYLANEGIPVDRVSVGGKLARRIVFWPMTGKVTERLIDMQITETPAAPISSGEPDLF